MQLKTILNNVERHKSFVYGNPRWFEPKNQNDDRCTNRAEGQQQADLLRVRPTGIVLRPPPGKAIRVRAAVGNSGLHRIHHAASGLREMWRKGSLARFHDAGSYVRARNGAIQDRCCDRCAWHVSQRIPGKSPCRYFGISCEGGRKCLTSRIATPRIIDTGSGRLPSIGFRES